MTLKNIQDQIDSLQKEFEFSKFASEEQKEKLQKKFRLEFHYNSNHIEGNTLTYSETELLLIFDETRGHHTLREYEEMKSSDVALEYVKNLASKKDLLLSETDIKNLNRILLVRPYWKEAITREGQTTTRKISIGDYKSEPNSVVLPNGEMFHYSSPQDTPILMNELLEWFRDKIGSKVHPLELASMLHYKFVRIHPFDDGNGRTARLLMNYVFFYYGFPPVIIKSEDKANYLSALRDADTGNEESFIKYIGHQLIWSLKLSLRAAAGEDIDEKHDWKKRLTILSREMSNNEEIKVTKSSDAVIDLYRRIIDPLIREIDKNLVGVQELFLRKSIFLQSPETMYEIFNDQSHTKTDFYKKFSDLISVYIGFDEFKKDADNTFGVSIQLEFIFTKFKYEVRIQDEVLYTKLYHQDLTQYEIDEIIGQCGKRLVDQIENKYKHK